MKKFFGILMLAVTLLSGITVLAQDKDKDKEMKGNTMNSGRGRRHHRRHHSRWHRAGRRGNKNDKH